MDRTTERKEPPPGGTEMFAGSAYFIYKRAAVEYIVRGGNLRLFCKPDNFAVFAHFDRQHAIPIH